MAWPMLFAAFRSLICSSNVFKSYGEAAKRVKERPGPRPLRGRAVGGAARKGGQGSIAWLRPLKHDLYMLFRCFHAFLTMQVEPSRGVKQPSPGHLRQLPALLELLADILQVPLKQQRDFEAKARSKEAQVLRHRIYNNTWTPHRVSQVEPRQLSRLSSRLLCLDRDA